MVSHLISVDHNFQSTVKDMIEYLRCEMGTESSLLSRIYPDAMTVVDRISDDEICLSAQEIRALKIGLSLYSTSIEDVEMYYTIQSSICEALLTIIRLEDECETNCSYDNLILDVQNPSDFDHISDAITLYSHIVVVAPNSNDINIDSLYHNVKLVTCLHKRTDIETYIVLEAGRLIPSSSRIDIVSKSHVGESLRRVVSEKDRVSSFKTIGECLTNRTGILYD